MSDLPDLIRRAREVTEAATKGERTWVHVSEGYVEASGVDVAHCMRETWDDECDTSQSDHDACAIVLHRNTYEALLAVLEAEVAFENDAGPLDDRVSHAVARAEAALREHLDGD